MDKQNDSIIQKALLDSGFPFQTAVADVIRQTPQWSIETEEFPWQDNNNSVQFLDIVAKCGNIFVGVECKKTRKDIYIFLKYDESCRDNNDRVRCFYLTQMKDTTHRMEVYCDDWSMEPFSIESSFCVVGPDKTNKNQRLLERDAQLLLGGLDAFVKKHRREYQPRSDHESDFLYLPVLITNAPLHIADYKPSDISLETGEFLSLPKIISKSTWIKFAKTFTPACKRYDGFRTIFVVNALYLSDFLIKLKAINYKSKSGIMIEDLGD
jgi:hypothetical protein